MSAEQHAAKKIHRQSAALPGPLAAAVQATLADWRANRKVQRLWERDASLWSGSDEQNWLGWLDIVDHQLAHLDHLKAIAAEMQSAGFSHALLLGMGGSSLCPEVLELTFGHLDGYPDLHVLDSTDPQQIRTRENQIELANTLFIVSSKSGSTLEPNIYKQYFFERARQTVGSNNDKDKDKAGSQLSALT